jgi:DNA-binding response OmpR family regulator
MQHVLVVEDDGALGDLLKTALEDDGLRVSCASRGLDALWHLENDRPDLAIIDVRLPDMSGIRVAKRAIDNMVAALLVTGDANLIELLRGYSCPMLPKPFRIADLLARVRALLMNSRAHHQHVRSALDRLDDKP